ncbi:MAG: hypothetical protein NTY53_23210, partial [Kiritimatiellaeota bacterium]|nr:hypothetical protein [Kiritimatiellota bacterium]
RRLGRQSFLGDQKSSIGADTTFGGTKNRPSAPLGVNLVLVITKQPNKEKGSWITAFRMVMSS